MIAPSGRLLALATGWLALAVLASVWPALGFAWQLSGWCLLGLGLADLLLVWRLQGVELARRAPLTLPLGVWSEVRLRVENRLPLALRLRVFDGHPGDMEQRGLPQKLRVPARGWGELGYQLRPSQRGAFAFGPAQLRLSSPLRFWNRDLLRGPSQPLRVYPNFAAVKKYALLATSNRLALLGVHQKRRRGEGMEFHQLREYRQGDALRQIDWKATSRLRKLISREYQDERDQQLVFLLDCGRRMRALEEGLSHFDHTLNAVLLLAHVALKEGDAVGLLSFAGAPRWLPPRKGPSALNHMLDALFDLQPENRATDYLAAAEACLARLKKRALVVLVTNLRDEDDDTLAPALKLLQERHRVLLASLRERELEEALAAPVRDFDGALLHGAVHDYLAHRRGSFERLAAHGVQGLDLLPSQLPLALVNRYLAMKRGGEL